ncbi:MAG TPA: hypothetical protein VEG34_02035, partial [Thermoanaerobaculia bacterium]|nr:hypothetical protein [Thermoanaerobaculia bacterium]
MSVRKKLLLAACGTLSAALLLQGSGRLLVLLADAGALGRPLLGSLLPLAAGTLLLGGVGIWAGVHLFTRPLKQLAATLAEMARTGQLRGDFPSTAGGREVRLIEETLRHLVSSLEESQRARERSYVEAVGAVVTAADARDHETTGHSFRVAHYAIALARAMGLQGGELKAIE